jgi:hypothetical protein
MFKRSALLILLFLAFFSFTGMKIWFPSWWEEIHQYMENRDITIFAPQEEFSVLEERLAHAFQQKGMRMLKKGQVYYAPFLYIKGEYRPSQIGRQQLLWCLTTGELVLNTQNWKKTQGMRTLLSHRIAESEMAVLNELASFGGKQHEKQLLTRLGLSVPLFQNSCKNLQNYQLISYEAPYYKLNMPRSHFFVCPQTEWWDGPKFTQTTPSGRLIPATYNKEQVLHLIEQGLFGKGFYVLSSQVIYLPLYAFQVKTKEGQIVSASWNSLSGRLLRKEDGYPTFP